MNAYASALGSHTARQQLHRASFRPFTPPVILHGGRDASVSRKRLDRRDVRPCIQEVGDEGTPEVGGLKACTPASLARFETVL